MTVGNWRDVILVKCCTCKRLMGWHKETTTAECVECEIERLGIAIPPNRTNKL